MRRTGNTFLRAGLILPLLISMVLFTTGCGLTDGSKMGLFAGLLVGGAFTMYQITDNNHSTAAASTPDPGEAPVESVKALALSFHARRVEEALLRFTPHVRDSYRQLFTEMKEKLPLIAQDIDGGNPTMGFKGSHFCEVLITRTEDDGVISYPVTFIRESDGEWRIAGF